MGEILRITCKKCNRSWQCNTGCGLLHGRLDFVVKAFPAPMQQEILAVSDLHPFALFDFGYHAAGCPGCQKIVNVPVLSFKSSEKEYVGLCPECGGRVDIKQPAACPVCQGSDLFTEKIGEWD